ncbi:putative O-fucosyltransferase, plant [Helianthus debilis subsp. tardiflorus]
MFGSLELQPEVAKWLTRSLNGSKRFEKCYGPDEIALFLKKRGFDKNSAVYLTQSRWDKSLDSLKDLFPNTYTKELIMPMDKKQKFLGSDSLEYEKVIDFYVCSESDVFVLAISGLFYANVGMAMGRVRVGY